MPFQTSDKFAPLRLAVTIQTGRFSFDVFKKFCSNRRRKLRIVHDAIDCRDAQPGIFVLAAEDGPRGAAREPKRLGLLIER